MDTHNLMLHNANLQNRVAQLEQQLGQANLMAQPQQIASNVHQVELNDRVHLLEVEAGMNRLANPVNDVVGHHHVQVKPLFFDGHIDVLVFLQEFERCRAISRWSDNESICKLLQCVQGPAKDLLLSCRIDQRNSIEALENVLYETYAPFHSREHKLLALENFGRLKGEDLQSAYVRLSGLINQVHPDPRDAQFYGVRAYLKAIDDPELRNALSMHQFASVAEMHNAALRLIEMRRDSKMDSKYSTVFLAEKGQCPASSGEDQILTALNQLGDRLGRLEIKHDNPTGSKNANGTPSGGVTGSLPQDYPHAPVLPYQQQNKNYQPRWSQNPPRSNTYQGPRIFQPNWQRGPTQNLNRPPNQYVPRAPTSNQSPQWRNQGPSNWSTNPRGSYQ